jgi:hypothetical protein
MPSADDVVQADCPNCKLLRELLDAALKRLAEVEKRLEEVERTAHRQAAPFRRPEEQRKADKGKPGRKKGHPPAFRKPPPVVDECADVPLDCCPQCQGPVHDVRAVEQIIQDIPKVCVHHLRLTTYRGHCPQCGPVHSTHPEQVSTAVGAAGTHLGRNALGLAADLSKRFGLPMRKVCGILQDHFGLQLTPGGLSQALARIAGKLQVPFQQLKQSVRASKAIHADETSWWVGGHSAWLWVFTNPALTLYTIDNRSQEVIRRILGDDYAGVLISDCLASYDPHPGTKSKCCAHHLKAISEARKLAPDSAFLTDIHFFFKAAIIAHRYRADAGDTAYWRAVGHLQHHLDEVLAKPYSNRHEERIANRLRKQRPHLLTFLARPDIVDPTNNLAERQLRPAVISRKLSCGNKTEAGKATFEVLASLSATCRQQGRSFTQLVAGWMSLGLPPPTPLASK